MRQNKKIKIVTSIILILLMLINIFPVKSKAIETSNEEERYDYVQSLETSNRVLHEGEEITIDVKVLDCNREANIYEGYIDYDKEVLQYKSLVTNDGWEIASEDLALEDENEKGIMSFTKNTENSENESIISIIFTVLKDTEDTIVKVYDSYMAGPTYIGYGQDKEITLKNRNANIGEELFLKTDKYQIGENTEYVKGDKYITNITEKTTLEQLKSDLKTNGLIKVYSLDKNELAEDQYVGTGMRIAVTKGEEEISLIIVVTQDADGNGKVTISDLSKVIADLSGECKLTLVEVMAIDADKDNKNSVEDLSAMINALTQN